MIEEEAAPANCLPHNERNHRDLQEHSGNPLGERRASHHHGWQMQHLRE